MSRHQETTTEDDECIVTLASGTQFDLLNPDREPLLIEDIAHGLAHTCRFAGQCPQFYSVAQHSVLVSQLLPDSLAPHGLLHDASEALMGDLHSGLKSRLPEYKRLETALLTAIYRQFKLNTEVLKPPAVAHADRVALVLECRALGMALYDLPTLDTPKIEIKPMLPEGASTLFLQCFRTLFA